MENLADMTHQELIDGAKGRWGLGKAAVCEAELLRRLGAAVSASPQPSPWFLIETAPRDGRHIQAADFRPGQVGFGGNPQQAYQCIVHWFEWGDGTHAEESGFYPSTGAGENPPLTNLTHWKPLEEFFAAAPAQEPRPANQIPPAYCETHDTVHKCENVIAEAQEQPVENCHDKCFKCGNPRDHKRHAKYGNDIDSAVKHDYEPSPQKGKP